VRIKQSLFNHIKNLPGWRTNRKLVVISVDDYGNVRLDSKKARENMDKAGLKVHSRFDVYDTLETREDLEALYEVLTSVKDQHGRHAVFTPFALPCNINFEAMAEEGYERYVYELLPETYAKLSARHPEAYTGAWSLWQEGIGKGLMAPQFHGREHLNLAHFQKLLKEKNDLLRISMQHRSLVALPESDYASVGWTAAFSFWSKDEIVAHETIIKEGVQAFERVFGYAPTVFTPPAQQFHPSHYPLLQALNLQAIDRPLLYRQHLGYGNFKRKWEYMHFDAHLGMVKLVRNVVFEPTEPKTDHVAKAMAQIEAAFRLGKPAIISSHRVNYAGLVDANYRAKGLNQLGTLLKQIAQRWPEVEFISAAELSDLISNPN
jgi:hypothetical protein